MKAEHLCSLRGFWEHSGFPIWPLLFFSLSRIYPRNHHEASSKNQKNYAEKNLEQLQESRTTNLMTGKQKKKSLNAFKNALINANTCKKSEHPWESLNIRSFRELDFSRLFENVARKRYTSEHEHWTNMATLSFVRHVQA